MVVVGTAYNSYLRADVLHSLQQQVTDDEGERSFLVICQIQELYFSLILHDITCAAVHLQKDCSTDAIRSLQRASSHFAGLCATWRSLTWMLPADFSAIKVGMTETYGRSSSLQSWKYRELLFRLGLKDASLAEELASMPAEYAQLRDAHDAPTVYQEALAMARRRGYDLPDASDSLAGRSDVPDPSITRFWGDVFAAHEQRDPDLLDLGRAFLAIAEGLAEYKHLHYIAVRRTLGNRPGYYGQSGVEWLAETLKQVPFRELWETQLGENEA
jgi:tryptophan 2,3-dioxygenase